MAKLTKIFKKSWTEIIQVVVIIAGLFLLEWGFSILFKTRIDLALAWVWWVAIIYLGLIGLFNYFVECDFTPVNIFTGVSTGIIMTLFLVICIANGDIKNAVQRYETVKKTVTVVENTEKQSAFPNLLGENGNTDNLVLYGIPEALKKCEAEMGKIPALGSQFELKEVNVTTQNIAGHTCYVIPLEPKNFLKWDKKVGNGGYFIVDRNTGETTHVETPLFTTEYAPFGSNAKRIILSYMKENDINGFPCDISPEVDDEGGFHYIATIYDKTGLGGMRVVLGVVDLNAITKECTFYKMGEIPEFVDRVYPEAFFEEYVMYYSSYKNGFWNSFFGQKEVQVLTADMDVIYIDGVCYYYSGLTSAGKGESSNGIIMMNSRTGKLTLYKTYGISEEKAQGVAMGRVQEKEYTASYPLLLKVGNEETYFMLMRDKSENLVGYAFVSYKDYTKAAVGENLLTVQADYMKACSTSSNANSLEDNTLVEKTGVVSEIATEVLDGTSIYYVRFEGSKQIYSLYSELYPEIVFVQSGEKLSISYVEMESIIIPVVEVK